MNVNLILIYHRKLSFSDEKILIIPEFGSSLHKGKKYDKSKFSENLLIKIFQPTIKTKRKTHHNP